MPTLVGTIPENLATTDVYTLELADLPVALTGRRPLFEELIYDIDGGFTEAWANRSSVSGTGPYTFLLGRRAFGLDALQLYAYEASGGGGGGVEYGGDLALAEGEAQVVGIRSRPVSDSTPSPGDVLTFDGSQWAGAAGGGAGDVVGPASSVTGRIATFNGTTGKLIADGGQTITQVIAAASIPTFAGYQGRCTGALTQSALSWTGFIGTVGGTYTDVIQVGVTRSGSTFTVAAAGYYRFKAAFVCFGQNQFIAYRLRSAGVTLAQKTTFSSATTPISAPQILDVVVQCTAGQAIDLQYVTSGVTYASTTPFNMDGEAMVTGDVTWMRVGV